MSDETYIDERLRMPGAGRGRDMGTQLDYDLRKPLLTGDGRPRTHTIATTSAVAGSRESESAFTGSPLQGSWGPATAIPVYMSGLVMTSQGVLRGYSARELTGSNPATFRIRDGIDANGTLLVVVTLNPGESVRDWFGESGVRADKSLYFELVTGSIEGSIWFMGTL